MSRISKGAAERAANRYKLFDTHRYRVVQVPGTRNTVKVPMVQCRLSPDCPKARRKARDRS